MPKKTVKPKTKVTKVTKTKRLEKNEFAILLTIIIFLSGALIGSFYKTISGDSDFAENQKIVRSGGSTYVSVKNLTEDFLVELGNDSDFAVYNGKTWIPVEGNPIELLVLNDASCKSCSAAQEIMTLRQNITPAFLIRTVDIGSEEGKELIEKFEITSIPKFILGAGIENFKAQDGSLFIENSKELVTQKDNLYLINSAKVGFKVKKFLEPPVFADLDTEPRNGNGKIRVVEFTDFQCPYSKRLHDQNKDLIARLVAEGKIEHILKDFPLGFHKEAPAAHQAANCVLQEEGNDMYWKMQDQIFATQNQWSGKGEAAVTHLTSLAQDLGVDITECMNDEEIKAEIMADLAEGQKQGVRGTPALFIGTKIMPGAIGPAVFEAAVEEQL